MLNVSQAFLDAQDAPTRHLKSKMRMILRNHAADSETAVATSSGAFSADYPAAGANNGDRTHINFGPAAGADNGVGLSGWKSDAAKYEQAINTKALWGVTGDRVTAMGPSTTLSSALNYFKSSEALGTAWTLTNVTVVANQIAPPYAAINGDRLMETAANGVHSIRDTYTRATAATPQFIQFKARRYDPGGGNPHRRYIQVAVGESFAGGTAWVNFDLQTLLAGNSGRTGTEFTAAMTASMEDDGRGWVWCLATFPVSTARAGVTITVDICILDADTDSYTPAYAGDVTAGVYLAELAANNTGTRESYFQTTGVACLQGTTEIDFESATYALGSVIGQDGWANVVGVGTWTINAATGRESSWSLRGVGVGVGTYIVGRAETFASRKYNMSCCANMRVRPNANDGLYWGVFDTGGGVTRFAVGLRAGQMQYWTGAAWVVVDTGSSFTVGNWYCWYVQMDRTTPASTVFRVFVTTDDSQLVREILSVTQSTVNIDKVVCSVFQTTGSAPTADFDNIRVNEGLNHDGTRTVEFDLGAVPVSGRALLTGTNDCHVIAEKIAGLTYSFSNQNTWQALKSAATNNPIAETITPTESAPIGEVLAYSYKTGAPVGNVWCEIWTAVAGAPGVFVARSQSVDLANYPAAGTAWRVRFPFVDRPMATNGIQMTLVFNGDYAVSGANYALFGYDNTGTYTGGQFFVYNTGTSTWTATAGSDFVFSATRLSVSMAGVPDSLYAGTTVAYGFGHAVSFRIPWTLTGDDFMLSVHIVNSSGAWTGNARCRIYPTVDTVDGPAPDQTGAALFTSETVDSYPTVGATISQLGFQFRRSQVALEAGVWYSAVIDDMTDETDISFGFEAGGLESDTYAWQKLADDSWIRTEVAGIQANLICGVWLENRNYISYSANYSTASGNYVAGDEVMLYENPERTEDPPSLAFTGALKRYWRISTRLRMAHQHLAADYSHSPEAMTETLKVYFLTEKWLNVQMDGDKVVNMVRWWAHPTEGGCRKFLIQGRPNGGAYANWTDPDTAIMEARKKGGSATITYDSVTGEFTTDGDYACVYFIAEKTVEDVKMFVRDNKDEWARLMEFEVRLSVDIGATRIQGMTDSRPAEYRGRRIKGAQLALDLINDDGDLSSMNAAGPYAGMLGGGVEIVPLLGLYGATDMIRLGTFYVSKWGESFDSASNLPLVRITAQDGTKKMSTSVSPTYKTNYRHHDIVEYLGNLAGIASTDMRLERTASRVSYFGFQAVDAYKEAQLVAEAIGYGMVGFDEEGYLFLKAAGTIGGSTAMESITNIVSAWGPPVFWNDRVWCLCSITNGGNEDLKLAYYDMATSAWTVIGTAISTKAATHAGLLQLWDDQLWILDFDADAGGAANIAAQLYVSDGATFTRVAYVAGAGNGPGSTGFPANFVDTYGRWTFAGRTANWSEEYTQIDLRSYQVTAGSLAGLGADTYTLEGVQEGVALVRADGGAGLTQMVAYSWDGGSSFTNATVYEAAEAGAHLSLGLTFKGFDLAGSREYYVATSSSGATKTVRLRLLTITSGGTITVTGPGELAELAGGEIETPYDNCDAIAYADGMVVGGWVKKNSTYYQKRHWYYDEDTGRVIEGASIHFSQGTVMQFRPVVFDSQYFVFGISGQSKMFEMRIRQRRPSTAVAVIDLRDDAPGEANGPLLGVEVEAGDDGGGDSMVTNIGIVESRPYLPVASATLWQGDGLPWRIRRANLEYRYKLKLETPAVPPQTVNVTTSPGGIISATISSHPQEPEVVLRSSGAGAITAITITGLPLKKQASLVSIVLGPKQSRDRYGFRGEAVRNDYIYDGMAQHLIAVSNVAGYAYPVPRVTGVKCRAFWHLQLFDRATIRERRRAFVDGDFYIYNMTRDAVRQTMSLSVEQVAQE